MHHKFCVIDNQTVITGSYNWTKSAETHHENIVIISNCSLLAEQYINEFNELLNFVSTSSEESEREEDNSEEDESESEENEEDESEEYPMVSNKKKYYFFFDTETTGLPKKFEASVQDVDNWPRLVQIAWILSDSNKKIISKKNYIIKPRSFTIPKEATKTHGITNNYAIANGYYLPGILNEFLDEIRKADYLVAHNMNFDEKIIGAELYRTGHDIHLINNKYKICTMKESVNYCKLKGTYGYKWPTLSDLYYKLFNSKIIESHNAENDIETTYKCFWELRKRGIL